MSGSRDAKIVVSGKGRITAEALAVGYQARAEKTASAARDALDAKGLAEARDKLDALMAALDQHSGRLRDPEPVFGLAERVAQELGRKKPDKLTLKGLLAAIADEAKSVAKIATAALSLKDLVAALF
jgi:hypothetical protein